MYRAKSHSENRYAFFDSELDRVAVERSQRIVELREGIVREEFRLDYQAVVDLDRNEIIGYEALVRWEHPTAGELPPGEFIPLAEETGLIVGLGEWVLTEACTEAVRLFQLHGRHDAHVGERLGAAAPSSRLLPPRQPGARLLRAAAEPAHARADGEHAARVRRARRPHARRRSRSSGSCSRSTTSGRAMRRSRTCGSSPIDVVKIDRSFTAHADSQNGDLVLLKGIIDLGHALELNLVAEGIETPEQHTIVRQLGCHQAQGFYFGRPSHPAQRDLDLD